MFPAYLQPLFHFSRKRTAFLWFSTKNTAEYPKETGTAEAAPAHILWNAAEKAAWDSISFAASGCSISKAVPRPGAPNPAGFLEGPCPGMFPSASALRPGWSCPGIFQKKGNGPGNDGGAHGGPAFYGVLIPQTGCSWLRCSRSHQVRLADPPPWWDRGRNNPPSGSFPPAPPCGRRSSPQ